MSTSEDTTSSSSGERYVEESEAGGTTETEVSQSTQDVEAETAERGVGEPEPEASEREVGGSEPEASEPETSDSDSSRFHECSTDEMDKIYVALEIVKRYKCRYSERIVDGFAKQYPLPSGYRMRRPLESERVCFPRQGEIGVYIKNFALGLRFPIHPDILRILLFIGLPIAQLPPNSLGLIVAFVCLCRLAKVVPSVRIFRFFFHKYEHLEKGWTGVAARPRRQLLKPNTSNKGWKDGYVFISLPNESYLPRNWTVINPRLSKMPTLSDGDLEDVQRLQCIDPEARDVDTLTSEGNLVNAGLSSGEDPSVFRGLPMFIFGIDC